MKKIIAALVAGFVFVSGVFAQAIPENRDLFVGVWKFAEENNYQNVSKYKSPIERFLRNEILGDTKINLATGETSYKKSFDFESGSCIDIDNDEYRILTTQVDKVLLSYTLHVFDWTIKNDDGNVSLKLNNSLTAIVDKNGNWTSSSVFQKAQIMNKKQIEAQAVQALMKHLEVSDEEYAQKKAEVVVNQDFIASVIPGMTELGIEAFMEENKIPELEGTFTFKVFEVTKNTANAGKFPADKYEYRIFGSSGKSYFWGYTNSTEFNKVKKDSVITAKGKIKDMKNHMTNMNVSFVME